MNKLLSFNPEPFASDSLHESPHQSFDAELESEFGSRRPRGRMPYDPNKNLRMQPRGMRKSPMPRPRPPIFPSRLPHGHFPIFPSIAPSWPILTDPERPLEPTEPSNAGYPGGEPSIDNRPSSDSASEHVRWVQNCLNHYLGLRLPTDGRLTAATRGALRLFQERRGLPANGLIGPETERALAETCNASTPPNSETSYELPFGEWETETALTDRWILPEDVRKVGETQQVRYDSAGAWANGSHCSGTLTPGAKALGQYILANFPGVSDTGGYNCRPNSANKNETSMHGVGRALDIMIPMQGGRANSTVGDPVANWLVRNAADIGIQYIIWNRVAWNGSGKTPKNKPYNGPDPHKNHIHAELNRESAERKTPWFQKSPSIGPIPPMPSKRPTPPAGVNYPPPPGYQPLRPPVPGEVVAKANEVLRGSDPIGTQTQASVNGKDYLFALEWHKHAQTDNVPAGLKNWHRGVTVYQKAGSTTPAPKGGAVSMRIDSPLPQSGPGFYSYKPQSQQYGLTETIRALQTIGAAWAKAHPLGPFIGIGDISKRGGGPMSGHKSHQLGLDVDIRLMRKDGRKEATTYQSSTYSRPLTQELINLIRANGVLKVQYIFFNDPQASGVSKWPNHDNHLHVRFYAPQSKGSQSPTPNWDKAIEQNRHYATSLGWQGKFDKIVALLGFSNMTPNERLFAEALARWQASQGMKADGILGPKTWGRMRPALPTPGIPAPVSGGLAFGAKVSAEFRNRVRQISSDIGIDPNFLMAAMAFETGETFSPSIRNKTSGATGLIQFMPKTATSLGTTTDALAAMTAEQQLDYVARYFSPFRGKLRSLEDVYMAILWPKAVGLSNETVLFAAPSMAYEQNKGLDRNGDGKVTKAEAAAPVAAKLVRGRQPGFVG